MRIWTRKSASIQPRTSLRKALRDLRGPRSRRFAPLPRLLFCAEVEDAELSEAEKDGLVKAFEGHEQSVFAAAWSAADAWIFASLSLDGKAVVNHVPPAEKYKILL